MCIYYPSNINRWLLSAWSSCSTTCGHGQLTRTATCIRLVKHPADYEELHDGECQEEKPSELIRRCLKAHCPPEWLPSLWGKVIQLPILNPLGTNFIIYYPILVTSVEIKNETGCTKYVELSFDAFFPSFLSAESKSRDLQITAYK